MDEKITPNYKYSQTCLIRPSKGKLKNGRTRQVVA